MRRRHFLQLAASAAGSALLEHASSLSATPLPRVTIRATGYYGQPATVTVTNTAAVGVSGWIAEGPEGVIHLLLEKHCQETSSREIEFPGLQPRRRYRLRMMNATASEIPIHLPGRPVELKRVHQAPVSGIVTDTIQLARYSVVDADLLL